MPLDNVEHAERAAIGAEQSAEQAVKIAYARLRKRDAVLRRIEALVRDAVSETVRGVVGLAGAGLVSYGAWLAWHPAGYLAGGTLLLAGIWLHDRFSA